MRGKRIWLGILTVLVLLTGAYFLGNGPEPASLPASLPMVSPTAEVETQEPTPTEMPDPGETPIPAETQSPMAEIPIPSPAIVVTPSSTTEESEPFCILTVRCDDVLQHMDKLARGKETLIPADGMIFPAEKISFSSGESVFDVLHRTMKERGIHMEFVNTPAYNSVYIEGIGNLYEFDCGDTSGWTYTVNGERPMHGSSQHVVEQGDKIEFVYKCNLFES